MSLHLALAGALLAAPTSALVEPSQHASHHSAVVQEPFRLATRRDPEDRFELTLSGSRMTSRDDVEGLLLYRAARIAKAAGRSWFTLLHLPGEAGMNDHPATRIPRYGRAYAHWQPHWSYYRAPEGWQPWHPEWGAPFWADESREVEKFEAHAMIRLGRGPMPARASMAFDAERILRTLGPNYAQRTIRG